LNNATGSTFGVPVHLQRYMVYDYCKDRGLNYEFELFELEDMAHLPTLQHVVHELKSNVVLYSIFSLPEERAMRNKLLDAVLANGLILHFVNEDMVIANEADRREVEQMLDFAKFGTSGLPIGLPTSDRIKTLMSSWGEAI
jgi:sporadic carbohydrate cluster protein (TIGR04323 family)